MRGEGGKVKMLPPTLPFPTEHLDLTDILDGLELRDCVAP